MGSHFHGNDRGEGGNDPSEIRLDFPGQAEKMWEYILYKKSFKFLVA